MGFRSSRLRGWGLGLEAQDLGLGIQGRGFRCEGWRLRVYGLGHVQAPFGWLWMRLFSKPGMRTWDQRS